MNYSNRASELASDIREYRHFLHQHAELSYEEHETTEFIVSKLREYGVEVLTFPDYTGCIATIRGDFPGIREEIPHPGGFHHDGPVQPAHRGSDELRHGGK